MNTNATTRTKKRPVRLICAVLAILMVLALCPVVAAEPSTNPTYDVWDGKVAGTDKTVPELVESDDVLTITEDVSASLEKIHDHTGSRFGFRVKDAAGFALLVVMTNKPNAFIVEGINTEATTVEGIMGSLTGKIEFAADIYLNDPNTPKDQWTNLVLPMWVNNIPTMGTGSLMDGKGHMIYGWKVDVEGVRATEQRGWGLIGNMQIASSYTIKNLAMVDAVMDVQASNKSADGTKKATLLAGGLVGNLLQASTAGGANLEISGCAVAIEMNIGYDSAGTASELSFGGGAPAVMAGGLYSTAEWAKHYNTDTGAYQNVSSRGMPTASDCIVSLKVNATKASGGSGNVYCGAVMGGQWSSSSRMHNILIVDTAFSGTSTTNTAIHDSQVWNIGWDGPCYGIWSNGSLAGNLNLITNQYLYGKVANREGIDRWDILDNPTYLATEMQKEVTGSGKTFKPFTEWTQAANCYPVPNSFAENADVAKLMSVLDDAEQEFIYTAELKAGRTTNISKAEDLVTYANLANTLGKPARINLNANIDMTGLVMPTLKALVYLDGRGHVISNMTINRTLTSADKGQLGMLADALSTSLSSLWDMGTIKNVAFVNYNATMDATAATQEYLVGGLFGGHGTNSVVENVYVQGNIKLNGSTVGSNGGRMGVFGAALYNWYGDIGITFNNCVFVGTASGPRAVAPYIEVLGNSNTDWTAVYQASANYADKLELVAAKEKRLIKINNCYTMSYQVDAEGNFAGWNGLVGNGIGNQAWRMQNVYQSGLTQGHHVHHPNSAAGYANVVDANGNSLWYLDCFNVGTVAPGGQATITAPLGGANSPYYLDEFIGVAADNAMVFSNPSEWLYFADGTPIPAVFGDNARALSITIDLDDMSAVVNAAVTQLEITGSAIALEQIAQLRFDAKVTADEAVMDKIASYSYGILIMPKLLMEQNGLATLTADAEGVLNIEVASSDTVDGVFSGATGRIPTYVFDGATQIDGRDLEFVAVPYFAYKQYAHEDATYIYGETVVTMSCVEVANQLVADPDTDALVVEQIVALYADLATFVAPSVEQ